MTVRPIIFSAPMVRALLEGRKTQTRRVWKSQPKGSWTVDSYDWLSQRDDDDFLLPNRKEVWGATDDDGYGYFLPYAPGDLLYVREAHEIESNHVVFAATDEGPQRRKFKPSIHMPRWASRLTLAVTDVRVQRLNEISEEDAIAEGVYALPNKSLTHDGVIGLDSAVGAFARLWRLLHGPGAWDQNPWVVAITFTVHRINVDQFAAPGKETETAA